MFRSAVPEIAKHSGLSNDEAKEVWEEVWNELALSGYAKFGPWLWLVAWGSLYIWLRFWEVLKPFGQPGEWFTSLSFHLAWGGAMFVAWADSMPRAVIEAKRRAIARERGAVRSNPEAVLDKAFQRGHALGIEALNPIQRAVFMIPEAEVQCEMYGILALIDRYGIEAMRDFGGAFRSVGASRIAEALDQISACPHGPEAPLLEQAQSLIVSRDGYSNESILEFIAGGT